MDNLQGIMPMLIVTLSACATMLAEAFRQKNERMPLGGLGLIGLVGAGAASALLWDRQATSFGVVTADNFSLFINFVLIGVGILTIVFSSQVIEREDLPQGEYYTLTLFAIAGMMLMAAATDLLVIFLALEILSLSVYVLTGIRRADPIAVEASFKYFLLGAFSSAFFLYGVAFTYAVVGSTRLEQIASAIASQAPSASPLLWLAIGLLLVGFAFKVSAVPFHMWAPDAYEGAPTVVSGFMSTAVKAAAFAAFLRVFVSGFEPLRAEWVPFIWAVAIVTIVLGTVVGVAQTNTKRMLAYSSIAHAGFLLMGLVASNGVGTSALLFYLAVYALTNVGAFGVIALIATREHANGDLRDFSGLWHTHPVLAVLMAIFLLSLGGFPPTAGFVAKWYVLAAAVQEGYYGLAITGVLASVIAVFFYLKIIVGMFMSDANADYEVPRPAAVGVIGLAVAALGVLYLGVLPSRVIEIASQSIRTVF